ncbi:hypothetical protein QBC36DRAFT_183249 [Triangularia setosa]|uniref:Uncharacterized protein n=1 Tax=Triangularia setosa TaxID=2587417 RepID=A0AAN6WA35_9PEZI|nr:hypothetical protein QBC36DRAFT_183249 [Podospora setosa]
MTRTGMSFVQVIRTFRLTMSEAGNLMNLVGQEQRKIDSFDEEVKRHLHTADLTWMDEYNKTHTPLITDHLTAKEIRQAKAFMRFTGFEDIASKLGEYVGVGAGRRFPILLNHFWGDGFKDLPPHFKAFCSEELEKMVSTWDDGREERPPPMSTPEMHVRLDPPPGTINPRRLVNSSEPAPPAQDPPIQGHSAGETPVGEPSSGNPPVPVSSAPSSLPPNLYGRYLHGLPTVDTGYHSAIQAQPAHPVQHGLPLYLPDPRHGVPINPFATLPPPSMPHNLAHSQHGAWQPCLPVQGQPHFPQWPQRQQMYHDRGMYWTSPVPRYREPANSHFTMAIGGGQSPVQAPVIIRRPYPPPPAHYQQLPGVNIAQPGQYQQFNLSPVFGHVSKGVDVSNSEGTPPEAGPQSHFRPLGPMDNHLQQVANHGRSMGAAQNAPHHVANLPMMGFVPQRQAISSTAGLGMASAGELSRQNMASGSRLKVPLLSAAQLAFLYDTYDKPRPSMGTLNYTAAHVARSAQGNPSNPIFGAQSALQHARPAGNMEQEDSRMPDAQPVKEVSDDPLLKYSPPKIQQRDASLQKDVEEWRSKFQDTWTSESESAADNDEEEILPPMPTRPNHARKFQEDDKSDEDFVLRKDDEVQEKKKEKRVKVSLPVASRKRAASAVSASAGATKRPRRAMKRFADTAAPVSGTANKRKAAQSGESQVAPKRRRANDEASTTRASSATSRNLRRRSAPAAGGVSEGGEHDDGKKSKPAKSRRQPGGIWGNADTIFTNDRGDFLKRSEVAALPNTKYRPGGSFGGGKWQEEDTGVIWLPVNPSEQCRKNSAEKETTANCAPGAEVIGAGEKKTKKSTKASQVVKKSIRLVSQEATPSPTQIGSSQATQSSATIRNSSPAMTPETQSFEEFLSSKGLHTREMFDTDSLFRQYVSSLGPPFSTHPDAPTLASTSKVKSLDNYIPPQTRDEHETYLAAQKTAEDEGSQPQDQATQENDKPVQEQTEEKTQEYSQESTRAEAQGKPQEKSQDMSHEKPRNKSEDKSQEQSQGRPQKKSEKGIQEATPKTIGDAIKETLETTGEAAKEIQEQTPVVKEAEKNNLPELLKEQGLDLDDPPALDTTEQLGRYSKRLRSAPLGLLPRRASSSRCASPTKEPPTKEPTATVTATKQTAAKNTATKIAETKEAAAKETDIQNVVTENATTVEPVSQNLVNLETMDGVMIIRTLRPRKGKEEDRGNSPAGPSEKK